MRIAIAGGNGFIGRQLTHRLLADGHEVVWLSHRPGRASGIDPNSQNLSEVAFDPRDNAGAWRREIAHADAIVNLSGYPIASRWNARTVRLIRTSRIDTTRALAAAIAEARETGDSPGVLVNASGIGVYGDRRGDLLDETEPPGYDLLATLCADWEHETAPASQSGARVVTLRTAPVLGDEGVLPRMLLAMRLFAGGPIGNGRQWFSWIHQDDIVGLYTHAITCDALEGPVNATAPEPLLMRDFASTLGRVLSRPSWLPIPPFALRLVLGKVAPFTLMSQRADVGRALASGYVYRFPTAEAALRDLTGRATLGAICA